MFMDSHLAAFRAQAFPALWVAEDILENAPALLRAA